MKRHRLSFQTNWNGKLSCKYFTTWRMHNPRKFYVGAQYEIYLNGALTKIVECVQVKSYKLYQVNDYIAALDAGYTRDEFVALVKNMYKNKNIDFETQLWDFPLMKTL